jgi:polyisoprenoid-binding protein YceI
MRTPKHYSSLILLFAVAVFAADQTPESVIIESGAANFDVATNMPGIEVKGSSNTLSGRASVSRDSSGLLIDRIHISVPVKTLSTGMKVRDEHMRKYIFVTPEGQTPDLEFSASQTACHGGGSGAEFTCQVSGNLSIRGVSRPFQTNLNIKQHTSGSADTFRVTGDGVVKLSDYGIKAPSQFGVSASNDVKLQFNLNAREDTSTGADRGGVR